MKNYAFKDYLVWNEFQLLNKFTTFFISLKNPNPKSLKIPGFVICHYCEIVLKIPVFRISEKSNPKATSDSHDYDMEWEFEHRIRNVFEMVSDLIKIYFEGLFG